MMFTSGLLGGVGHCVGMCGPIVSAYSVMIGTNRGVAPHILFSLGRISTYSMMGGASGFFAGSFLLVSESMYDIQNTVKTITAVLIICMGTSIIVLPHVINVIEKKISLLPVITRFFSFFKGASLTTGAFYPVGILCGFMPCGLVYTGLITAARVSMGSENHLIKSILAGIGLMFVFGVGTSVALVLFGKISAFITKKAKLLMYNVSAFVMIIMGIIILT